MWPEDVWGVIGAMVCPIEWPGKVRGVFEGIGEGVFAASTGTAAIHASAKAANAYDFTRTSIDGDRLPVERRRRMGGWRQRACKITAEVAAMPKTMIPPAESA